jgi:hypothetical protein
MNGLLNEREAAEYLQCSVALVRKWRLFKMGPAIVRLGRLVRYALNDLDAYVAAQRSGGHAVRT